MVFKKLLVAAFIVAGLVKAVDEMDLDCPILKCEDDGLEENVCY